MKTQFLDALADMSLTQAEYFRANGVVATLTARSTNRSINCQALDLSHAKWHGSLTAWDSGEAEISLMRHKSGSRTTRQKQYESPEKMREDLHGWLLQVAKF